MALNGSTSGLALTPAPQELPLRDIHLPAEIGFWPIAPGWWLMLGLLLLTGLGLLLWRRQRQRRHARRLALRRLARLEGGHGRELAAALSRLLRQSALCYYPRTEVAGLCGREWLAFLDRPFPDAPFSHGIGRVLAEAPYRRGSAYDAEALRALCRDWLMRLPPAPVARGRAK